MGYRVWHRVWGISARNKDQKLVVFIGYYIAVPLKCMGNLANQWPTVISSTGVWSTEITYLIRAL